MAVNLRNKFNVALALGLAVSLPFILASFSWVTTIIVFASFFSVPFVLPNIFQRFLNDVHSSTLGRNLDKVVIHPEASKRYVPGFEAKSHPSNIESLLAKYQHVDVIRSFIGQTKALHDLREFDQWYPQDVAQMLIAAHNHNARAISVLFTTDFIQEITQFKMLLNNLEKPGVFICMEPGAGQNHYICGVIHNNALLLVNPVGLTQHRDFYERVQKLLDTQIFKEVYLSSTKLQHDPKGLVSCGPICVALCQHFAQLDIPVLFNTLKKVALSDTEQYKRVDISKQLPQDLAALSSCDQKTYHHQIIQLRKAHLGQLLGGCQGRDVRSCNDYFEDVLNNHAQVLLRKLCTGDMTLIDLFDSPEFNLLKGAHLFNSAKRNTP
ncbi:MAG: hypothetical protein AB7V32_00250 [Candidatus Berkiella sp.]